MLTWQARRVPSVASRRVILASSIGRITPPPWTTLSRQRPHVPIPPQAEGRWIPASIREAKSLPPAGALIVVSSLTVMSTSPVATSLERAAKTTSASPVTIAVNNATPRATSSILRPHARQ
jgi:hypothetical protein